MAIQLHQHRDMGTPYHLSLCLIELHFLPKDYTHHNNIDDHHYECADVSSIYSAEWMISYIQHMNIHSPYCVHNWCPLRLPCWMKDFLYTSQEKGHSALCVADDFLCWMTSYIHHIHMDKLHYAHDDVPSWHFSCWMFHHTQHKNIDTLQMCKFTSLQNTVLPEGLVANTMWIWPIPTIYALMFLESNLLSEWCIMQVTRIQMIPTVHVLMML
jgi:hypothetical protein